MSAFTEWSGPGFSDHQQSAIMRLEVCHGEQLVRYRGETETGLMKAIKATLDPKNIMNPGRVI
jgi:hypothetical protein